MTPSRLTLWWALAALLACALTARTLAVAPLHPRPSASPAAPVVPSAVTPPTWQASRLVAPEAPQVAVEQVPRPARIVAGGLDVHEPTWDGTVDLHEPALASVPEAYEGWSTWCEPLERQACAASVDCPADPWRPGVSMACVRQQCRPRDPGPAEQAWRRARLAALVEARCGAGCNQRALTALLWLEALKESSFRPWARHRMQGDLHANARSWTSRAEKYGHRSDADGLQLEVDGNPHFAEPERWSTGLGLYGSNAALHTSAWDPMAPPEVLCREEIATEAWLRRARASVAKIASGIDCDGDGKREYRGLACNDAGCGPSWYDVHNATAAGKLCPSDVERMRKFARRAKTVGLDPWARVRIADLGEPIPRETQNEVARELRARMDAVSGRPW